MSTKDAPVGVDRGPSVLLSSRWRRAAVYAVPLALAVVFSSLSVLSRRVHHDNEARLLEQQTDQAASVFELRVQQIRAPLDGLAQVVATLGDDPGPFESLGRGVLTDEDTFVRLALFDLDDQDPVTTVGSGELQIAAEPDRLAALLAEADGEPFMIVDLLGSEQRTLGYAVVDDPADPSHVIYGERALGQDPAVRRRTEEAFTNLDYALYMGDGEDPDRLLSSSTSDLPLGGHRTTVQIPFGDAELLLVTSPMSELGSRLLNDLWWIILLGGSVVAVSSGVFLARISRSRERALTLAGALDAVYREQRDIAETLQLALLPQHLAAPPGCELAVRYWPAGTASLIGGDFYDVFPTSGGRWVAMIGDVCGHGVSASAMTGVVRHTLRAAASHVSAPTEMLRSIHRAVRAHDPTTFCTVCLILYEPAPVGGGQLVVSLAGHHHPLLRLADGTVEAVGEIGTLLGVIEPRIQETLVTVRPGDTLLLFTDGLTDAPGDQGVPLEEITDVLSRDGGQLEVGPLADEIRQLKRRRRPHGSTDDTAVVVLRFGVATTGNRSSEPDVVIAAGPDVDGDPDFELLELVSAEPTGAEPTPEDGTAVVPR